MMKTSDQLLTLEEFLQLPATKPAGEFIDGQIRMKPMPQGEHSAIQTELAAALNQELRSQKIARAFAELRCTFGERSIVPDIAVFAWPRIPRREDGRIANVVSAAPDWVIEILSPEQRQMRVTKNILHCLQYETQMGWLVDPEEALVLVYRPDQPTELCEVMDVPLPVPDFAHGFQITLQEIFQFLCE